MKTKSFKKNLRRFRIFSFFFIFMLCSSFVQIVLHVSSLFFVFHVFSCLSAWFFFFFSHIYFLSCSSMNHNFFPIFVFSLEFSPPGGACCCRKSPWHPRRACEDSVIQDAYTPAIPRLLRTTELASSVVMFNRSLNSFTCSWPVLRRNTLALLPSTVGQPSDPQR